MQISGSIPDRYTNKWERISFSRGGNTSSASAYRHRSKKTKLRDPMCMNSYAEELLARQEQNSVSERVSTIGEKRNYLFFLSNCQVFTNIFCKRHCITISSDFNTINNKYMYSRTYSRICRRRNWFKDNTILRRQRFYYVFQFTMYRLDGK